jgi:CDP-diacylglycerol--serine O-phosphatidyltransferase
MIGSVRRVRDDLGHTARRGSRGILPSGARRRPVIASSLRFPQHRRVDEDVIGTAAIVDGRPLSTRRKGIYLLPNLLTTGGLFAGFYAIVAAIDGNFAASAYGVFAAMFLDGLDGRVARLTSTSSEFGKEYDSLADMVSFGLAPAIVTYQWGVERLSEYGAIWGRLGWLAAFLYVAAAAFRLARFNTNVAQDKRFFQGLASPAAAVGVVTMVWLATIWEVQGLVALVAGITITAVTGLLMMSRFAYSSFKDVSAGRRLRFPNVLVILLVIIVIAIEPPVTVFTLFLIYASSGPVAWLWHRRRAAKRVDAASV